MYRLAFCAAIALGTVGCSRLWPWTDIRSINSEDISDYEVAARVSGDELDATVCAERMDDADQIASRIVQQLYSHGYRTIRFDFVPIAGSGRPVQRVWTPDRGLQPAGGSGATPRPAASPRCADRAPAPLTPAGARSPDR